MWENGVITSRRVIPEDNNPYLDFLRSEFKNCYGFSPHKYATCKTILKQLIRERKTHSLIPCMV